MYGYVDVHIRDTLSDLGFYQLYSERDEISAIVHRNATLHLTRSINGWRTSFRFVA